MHGQKNVKLKRNYSMSQICNIMLTRKMPTSLKLMFIYILLSFN
jgi:hypothetical protein